MITRLWFSLSCLWALLCILGMLSLGRINDGVLILIVLPFAIGFVIRLIWRYVVWGSFSRPY